MKPLYAALALTIAGNVVYHLSQKSISSNAHPLVSIVVSYGVALVLSLLAFFAIPLHGPLGKELLKLNWATYTVGAAIVAVELGFLLAYRAGWRVSLGAVTSNTAVALLLVPAGVMLFHERISLANAVGFVFCVLGIALVTR
jgi:hypothetical protein